MTILESMSKAQKEYEDSLLQEKLITFSSAKKYKDSKGRKLQYEDFTKQRENTDRILKHINSDLPL